MPPSERRASAADRRPPEPVIDQLVAELATLVGTDTQGAANDDPALKLVAQRLEQLRAHPADGSPAAPARRRVVARHPPANLDEAHVPRPTRDVGEHRAETSTDAADPPRRDRVPPPYRGRHAPRTAGPDARDVDAVILAAAQDMDYSVRWLPPGTRPAGARPRHPRRARHSGSLLRWVLLSLAIGGAALMPLEAGPRVTEPALPDPTEWQVSMTSAAPADPATHFTLQNRRMVRTIRVDGSGRFLPPMLMD